MRIGDRERLSVSAVERDRPRKASRCCDTHGTDYDGGDGILSSSYRGSGPAGGSRPAPCGPRRLLQDGSLNLWQAIVTAAAPQSRGYGALICMNDMLLDAEDVLKCSPFLPGLRQPVSVPPGFIEKSVPRFCRLPKRAALHAEGRKHAASRSGWVHAAVLFERIHCRDKADGLILICPEEESLPGAEGMCRGSKECPSCCRAGIRRSRCGGVM